MRHVLWARRREFTLLFDQRAGCFRHIACFELARPDAASASVPYALIEVDHEFGSNTVKKLFAIPLSLFAISLPKSSPTLHA